MNEEKHIRTVRQVAKYFKEKDEHTAVTYGAIKAAADRGDIHSTKVGTRTLIVLEDTINYFTNM